MKIATFKVKVLRSEEHNDIKGQLFKEYPKHDIKGKNNDLLGKIDKMKRK